MVTRSDLKDWVLEAIRASGGSARVPEVAEYIWTHSEGGLKRSGNLLYKWQYDMRWAALELRKEGKLKPYEPRDCYWKLA